MVKYGRPTDEKQVKKVNVNGYLKHFEHLAVIKLCVQAGKSKNQETKES